MKNKYLFILLSSILLIHSCIVQFIPDTDEQTDLLVVEGLITDQPVANIIKLSQSLPLGSKKAAKPVKGYIVWISDDSDNEFYLNETVGGTYVTDPALFQGIIGKKYTLHIDNNSSFNRLNYKSLPVEMKSVPTIDTVFYEKKLIKPKDELSPDQEGCQIYLNTYDEANNCKYYRWEYSETWEFRLPYSVTNRVCWITNNSEVINIKNTSVLEEDKVNRYPLNFISNQTDRLKVKYSILVHQYSLSEDEYIYWEKLKNISEEVGGLYDIIPAAIPSNISCLEDPNETVLGYFSVSAVSSKRFFIKDYFSGLINQYSSCVSDTVFGRAPIPGLNVMVWLLEEYMDESPPYRLITEIRGCADCTVRGTTIKPLFWDETEK